MHGSSAVQPDVVSESQPLVLNQGKTDLFFVLLRSMFLFDR
jgi:hypothetical protein